MKKIKAILTASLLSLFSFAWVSTSSALELSAAGIGMTTGAWMGKGKEVIGTATGDTTEEDGAFEDGAPNIFLEIAATDNLSIGIEYWPDSVDTPENTNTGPDGPEGTNVDDNTVKASFSNHTTLYGQVGLPFGLYAKAGIIYVDIETKESLATGGAYDDADTLGYSLGFGYQHTLDNAVFIRAEINAAAYDDVSGTNKTDSSKSVSVTDMYGAYGSIKIGRSF
tara:strand:+ start:210 stop:881 length:672 start_codon:yes stop_codon:yes gene_type:complete